MLYDTREAILRDDALAATQLPLAGAMHYVELDVNNLDRWFTGALAGSGGLANNTTGYTVYFSDRRGDRVDPAPPPPWVREPQKSGAWGYDDIVNPNESQFLSRRCPTGSARISSRTLLMART